VPTGNRATAANVHWAMRTRTRSSVASLLAAMLLPLALLAVGCSGEDDGVETGGEPGTGEEGTGEEGSGEGGEEGGAELIDAASWEQDWGCGYGFRISDEAQTTTLAIEHPDSFEPPLAAGDTFTVELPDPAWQVEARLGTDLYANWCNDVVVAGAPEPKVAETWTAVSGTLEVEVHQPDCGNSHAEVEATDLVLEDPDGERVALDEPVWIVNTGWGCFAG
jgi:hypothetical protein